MIPHPPDDATRSGAALDLATLDPGIRDVVAALVEAGFTTSDSGDGVSKAGTGQAYTPWPHVVVRSSAADLADSAERVWQICRERWGEPTVEPGLFRHDGGRWDGFIFVAWLPKEVDDEALR